MKNKFGLITFFSIISFILINIIPPSLENLAISGMLIAAYIIFAFFARHHLNQYSEEALCFKKNETIKALSIIFSAYFGLRFFSLWLPSGTLLKLCFGINIIKIFLITFLPLLFMCGTYFAFHNFLKWVCRLFERTDCIKLSKNQRIGIVPIIVTALTSIVLVTLCSKSSPIYPLNDWNDANCFFTVGKAVANDVVLYRDIFEQKGPLLYFMHSFAYLISNDTFFGVYLLELFSGFLLLIILYKTVCIFTDPDSLIIIPALAVIIYSSNAFAMGDSAEEFCLPCLSLCSYFGIKSLYYNKKLKPSEWFLTGLTASFVLWFKFSLLGFYIGFGIFFAFLYIKNKWIKQAFTSLFALMCGIVVISIPIFIYFIVNGAVKDLFEVYFYDNLFLYTPDSTHNKLFALFENLYKGVNSFVMCFPLGLIFILLGHIFLSVKNKKVFYFNLCTFVFSLFFIYSGGRNYPYYSLIMAFYIPFGIIPLFFAYKKYIFSLICKSKRSKAASVLSGVLYSIICIAAAFLMCSNTYMLKYSKEDLPQYAFAEIMSQTENSTLFEYKYLDSGFYTVSNIVPTCKFFCGLNIDYDVLEDTQNEYIEKGATDYIVVRGVPLKDSQLKKYKLIAQQEFETAKNTAYSFYLYKKI